MNEKNRNKRQEQHLLLYKEEEEEKETIHGTIYKYNKKTTNEINK